MQGGSGFNAVPPAFDKSRVLDVKPLRSLRPIFPNANEAPPFLCPSPSGPFPPGYSPFYPFSMPPPSEPPEVNQPEEPPTWTPPAAPAPIRAFRTPEMANGDVDQSGKEAGPSNSKKRSSSRTRGSTSSQKKEKGRKFHLNPAITANYVVPVSQAQREDGSRYVVDLVLITFDGLRRRLSQLEDAKEVPSGLARRSDLRAANILMTKGFRTNMRKRIGVVPGVEVGDIFFFRMELCMVGLHSQSMGGIDWIGGKGSLDEEPLAVSIVSSGYYDDDAEDKDILIYSGQGGAMTRDKPVGDQKLERGNLALERSMRRANEVRVIRGIRDVANPNAKIYVYDGLYVIQESWVEKGKSGANTFKYKFVRVPGQPEAFAVWKSIEKWKENISSRPGLILPDLTSGVETIAVSLVNDFDDEKGPAYFTYCSTPKYSKSFAIVQSSYGCGCRKGCAAGDLNCACIRKNSGDLPYTTSGVLVSRKPLVYECGPSCPCGPNCKIRVSQSGLKVRLEVFKTKDRGWGLRSYDPIRAGAFICEYAGEVIDKDRLKKKLQEGDNDEYIFDSSRSYEPFKWNYEPGLLGEEGTNGASEDPDIPSPVIMTAKDFGNVARFMNHSCNPNVFWQPVIYEENNESFVHIAFFAVRHIPLMTELTYDYGTLPQEGDDGFNLRKKKCLCGTSECRDYFVL